MSAVLHSWGRNLVLLAVILIAGGIAGYPSLDAAGVLLFGGMLLLAGVVLITGSEVTQ